MALLLQEVKPEELAPLRHERLQQLRLNWTTRVPPHIPVPLSDAPAQGPAEERGAVPDYRIVTLGGALPGPHGARRRAQERDMARHRVRAAVFRRLSGADAPLRRRDIKKSPWPALSTALAARGLTVVDHTGRAWRPRLQVQP